MELAMSLIRDGILLFDNFYNKANEFNNRLVDMSGDRNILFFLSHSESINSSKQFNDSKLHHIFE